MIKINDLTVTFNKNKKNEIKAVSDLTLNVEKGDAFALIGKNGAGKSTTFNSILGLITPDSGDILIDGKETLENHEKYEFISYLPESPIYHDYLTVFEAVEFYTSFHSNRIDKKRIIETLKILSLEEFKNLPLSKCSKGMKQKVGIASCIVTKPKLLLLDEPTRGLDPIIVKEFRDILTNINNQGTTILLNSHMLSEIDMFCNKVAIIDKGKLIKVDKIDNLKTVDYDNYELTISLSSNLPDYFNYTSKDSNKIKGIVDKNHISEFFNYANRNRIIVYSSILKNNSLEDAFINLIRDNENE